MSQGDAPLSGALITYLHVGQHTCNLRVKVGLIVSILR